MEEEHFFFLLQAFEYFELKKSYGALFLKIMKENISKPVCGT